MTANIPTVFAFFILKAIIFTAQNSEACVTCGLKNGAWLAQPVAIGNENFQFLRERHALHPAGRVLRSNEWTQKQISPFVREKNGPRSNMWFSKLGTDYGNNLDFQVALMSPTNTTEEGTGSLEKSEDSTEEGIKVVDPVSGSMVATIGFYKGFISPLLPPACRFLPTCSQYGVEAIETFGPGKGIVLTAWRILRCSPFGGRGYDPPRWPPVFYTHGSY